MSKDPQFRFDVQGCKKVDQAMADALAKSAFVLQDEIREEQVIPRMDGTLSGEAFNVDVKTARRGYVTLNFNTPYARRLYFHPEYRFHKSPWVDSMGRKHDGNPNAQGEWMRHWLPGGKYQSRFAQIFHGVLNL